MGVSKAFTQSQHLHPNDRLLAVLPPFIGLQEEKRAGLVATSHQLTQFEAGKSPNEGDDSFLSHRKHIFSNVKSLSASHALLLFRPLYGSRDAPLRRYITISAAIRQFGFVPLENGSLRFRPPLKGSFFFPPFDG